MLELWYFTWVILVTRPSRGYHDFLPWTLAFELDLFLENFNLANNFWTVSAWALIFHIGIPGDKTFPYIRLFFTLWEILRFSYWFQDIWMSLWPWPSLELAIISLSNIGETIKIQHFKCNNLKNTHYLTLDFDKYLEPRKEIARFA